MPHISIKAEKIFELFGLNITNSMIASSIVFVLTIFLAFHYLSQSKLKRKSNLYYLINFFVKSVHDLFSSVLGEKIDALFPLLFSFFFYILLENWFGLLPGVGSVLIKVKEGHNLVSVPILRGNNADLNTTLALALISFFLIQYYGIKELGFGEYSKKFINFKNPIAFFTGILETISEFSKIISFSFRLFGNIFAGEVLLAIMAFLIPVLVSFPFLLLEMFVGLIQAIVFSMLTAIFMKMAMAKSH